jgi:hypothetical protein
MLDQAALGLVMMLMALPFILLMVGIYLGRS